MKPLFRFVIPEQETDALRAPNPQDIEAAASSLPELSSSERGDSASTDGPETRQSEAPEGMISASDLPSATEVLADLFTENQPEEAARDVHTIAEGGNASAPVPDEGALAIKRAAASSEATNQQLTHAQVAHSGPPTTAGAPVQEEANTDAIAPGSVEMPGDGAVDLRELIGREVAAATPQRFEPADESGATFEIFGDSPEPIPLDPALLDLNLGSESETGILSIDLAQRAVDRATKDNVSPLPVSAGGSDSVEEANGPAPVPRAAANDWALEEQLAAHKEWAESRGVSGTKANLAGTKLENAELIGVNLRNADLQDSNLKGADLLLADLRDACLVRANLQEACLVGANLEGANLEGATLDRAMGLVARQLAGANLHDASLPAQVLEFDAQRGFVRASQMAARFFSLTMVLCALSALMIWQTKDLQLLANSAILPFLHSPAAAAALPTAQIYLIAPVVLFVIYLVFHFHLQALCSAVLELPAVFTDGRELGQKEPRIVRGLLRAHFRWMNRDAISTQSIERIIALLLAYWVAPLTLLLFWARYLTLQDAHGTALHLCLVVVASGVALYSTTKVGRPAERWATDGKRNWQWVARLRDVNPVKVAVAFGVLLLYLTVGTIQGVPHEKNRAPQFSAASVRRWAPSVFWSLGYDPYADLTEAFISKRPPKWSGSDDQIPLVTGAKLSSTNFRYAQAYGVFLVNAHLWRSDFEGAFLSDADLRGADLSQSILRYAIVDRARLYHANFDRGNLDGANLNRADFREANLSYCSIEDAILVDAQFQGASLYGARLNGASMERANLERADLRSAHLDDTNLDHANLQQAYFWSAKLPRAVLRNTQLGSAIFIDADLQNADLRGAQLSGTVFNGANLTGANVDETDLRGGFGLTAAQVCSTGSRRGAMLTEALAAQVQAACGGPLLVAPAPVAVVSTATGGAGSPPARSSVPTATPKSPGSAATPK
jgi:uncharacterized protein YjbI with pentapeptide repeats